MIMKANKQIGFIYKNNESIDKILKDGDVVFEKGFLRERTSTTLPITFGGVGKDLKDYKVHGNTVQSKLPDGYTQVDYIESSGTQYIDTGLKSTPNTKFDFEFASTKEVGSEFEQVLGSQIGATNNRIYILIGGSNNIQLQFPHDSNNHLYMNNDGTFTSSSSSTNLLLIEQNKKNRIIFDIPNRALTVNEYTSISTGTYDLTSSEYNILIFNRNDTTVPTVRLAKGKLYNFKWYESNVLVRDFIPCYRNSDNEIGLYDLVNNVFYTNQGTGVFTYGSVAPTPDAPIEMVSCGDLITDSQDENYGKYKIPVNVNNTIINIYLDEPLRKIDGYSDYIDFINGKIIRQIGETIFDGSETWNKVGNTSGNYFYFYSTVLDNIVMKDITKNMLCNKFNVYNGQIVYTTKVNTDTINVSNRTSSQRLKVLLLNTRINSYTNANFKTWLSENNVTVDYVLETPTQESITLPNIPTLDGNNTLNIETEITPSQVYIKYKSNE